MIRERKKYITRNGDVAFIEEIKDGICYGHLWYGDGAYAMRWRQDGKVDSSDVGPLTQDILGPLEGDELGLVGKFIRTNGNQLAAIQSWDGEYYHGHVFTPLSQTMSGQWIYLCDDVMWDSKGNCPDDIKFSITVDRKS